MAKYVDDQLSCLAALPNDRSLSAMEAEVGRRISLLRRDARTLQALAPIRLAASALSLVVGISVGGFLGSTAPVMGHGLFETAVLLAPSALLEGDE